MKFSRTSAKFRMMLPLGAQSGGYQELPQHGTHKALCRLANCKFKLRVVSKTLAVLIVLDVRSLKLFAQCLNIVRNLQKLFQH